MRWLKSALVAAALTFTMVPAVHAQEEPPPPEDKNADWSQAFEQGLDLLRAKRVNESIRAFELCIKLFPDRAVAYYNIACAHSIGKRTDKAVEWLEKSFDKGFLDLAHVGRDSDLDNVRDSAAFKALIEKTRKKILANRPEPKVIFPKKREGKLPLVVFLHAVDSAPADVAKKFAGLADATGCAVLIPAGRAGANDSQWDDTAETCIVADVKAVLANEDANVDADKVVLVGELHGASLAWKIAIEHGWKRVVAAAGAYDKIENDKGKGLRAWLVAPRAFDAALEQASLARDEVLRMGGRVYVERHDEKSAFDKDALDEVARAVRWTLDDDAKTPDQGDVRRF